MSATDIGQATTIPLTWLVIVALFLLTTYGGGVAWLVSMHSDVDQAKRDVAEAKVDNREVLSTIRRLDHSVIQIKAKLKIPDDRD